MLLLYKHLTCFVRGVPLSNHVIPLVYISDVQRLTPIPIAEFSEVVKKKHFNANIAFEDEFEVCRVLV